MGSVLFAKAQYQFSSNEELKTAVDAWTSDSLTAATSYGPISTWDVSQVTSMISLFSNKESFNSDISSWDVSNVTDMSYMFYKAGVFNSDISIWDVSNVTTMKFMFYYANSFMSDISSWDVSNVTNMDHMFYFVSFFNSDISSWNVSNVTNLSYMFYGAWRFNSDISSWNVSNVTTMKLLFCYSKEFNSDISGWDVSNVTDMSGMFFNASSYSIKNYNKLLKAWSLSNLQRDVIFDISTKYCATEARQKIIDDFGWIINDGGLASEEECEEIVTSLFSLTNSVPPLEIAPNPAQDYINVQWKNNTANITVLDVTGSVVYTGASIVNSDNCFLDVSEFEKGVYVLQVQTELGTSTSRFVKE